jgi:DNA-binding MarR family transcriptional regulator
MRTDLTDTEARAWQALLHAHEQIVRALDAELRAEQGISLGTYDILLRLARAPERTLTMTELAERVMQRPSTLTRKIDGLVAQGLVERKRSESDSRLMHVRLGDEGLRIVRRAARTHLQGIRREFTGRLSEAQLESVAGALELIAGPHQPH